MEILNTLPTYPFIILAALLSGLFLFINSRRNAQKEAAQCFRNVISETLSKLKNCTEDTISVLETDFVKHENAVFEYSSYLFWQKRNFLSAWQDYAFHPQTGIRFLEAYTSFGVSVSKAKTNRNLAQQKLEQLLKYARP